jgi:hypothetical protein
MKWCPRNTGCQLDTYKLQNPYDSKYTKLWLTRSGCWYSKWFSQRPLLSGKQQGWTKKFSSYFYSVAPSGLLLLLTWRSGRCELCGYWRSSVGWMLCWDDADTDDYVAGVPVVLLVLAAWFFTDVDFETCTHFPTIITYYFNTTQAILKGF